MTDHEDGGPDATESAEGSDAAPAGEGAEAANDPTARAAADEVAAVVDETIGVPDDLSSLTDENGDEISLEDVDVVALLEERAQFLEAYQRTAADFDNFRKLSGKRLEDEVTRTMGSFIDRMLPVLDAIDGARGHGSDDVEAVATALLGFLEKEGLERVDPVGKTFDPNVAEAVMHEPGSGDGEPTVTEVLRTGYLWKGRVIRPAMVKVAG